MTKSEIDSIQKYDRFKEDLDEWVKALKAYYYHRKEHFETLPNTPNEIIFLGNSITDGAEWFELFGGNPNIKNRGIGGDDTDGVLARLKEVTESKPDKVFVMIGTNDLATGKSVDYISENHKKIIQQIQAESPKTRIYMESILPVDEAIHTTRPNKSMLELNQKLKALCEQHHVVYLNMAPLFMDQSGKLDKKYSLDGLHLNGNGYLKWVEFVKPFVEEK